LGTGDSAKAGTGTAPQPSNTFNTSTNQITSSGYTYDAAGNMTNDGLHTYTYDAEGNITKVDSGTTALYNYDALNHRFRTYASGATTEFVFNQNGQRVSVWNATTKTVERDQYYWGGKPVAFTASGATHFQHQDYLGTERMRTTYSGAMESAFTSLPFGDGYAASGSDLDPYHYAQLDYDSESNTSHAQFRQYSSTQGRWLRPDPYYGSYVFTNPQSLNRYAYTNNNPLSATDPSGLDDQDDGPCDDDSSCVPFYCDSGYCGGGDESGDYGNSPYTSTPQFTFTADTGAPWCYGDTDPSGYCSFPFIDGTVALGPGFLTTGGGGAPNNAANPPACQATLLNMANQQLGTNFNSSNVSGSYMNGTAYNIIIQSNQLTAAQFNNIQQGRYTTSGWQYLTGAGLAGHIADETNLGFAQSAFQSSNIGGNLSVSFAFHDDHGYANNPIGTLIHWITDVLGHNTRKPC